MQTQEELNQSARTRDYISAEVVAEIQAAGFDVYAPAKGLTTYLYFTDGKRIGYLQNDRLHGYTLTTVHVPCKSNGTGFGMGTAENFSRRVLERAFLHAPGWAVSRDVRKYGSIESFLNRPSNRIIPLEKLPRVN